ncbi:MAG: glutamine synthetase family protein [Elainellaceae cyanobacterium]
MMMANSYTATSFLDNYPDTVAVDVLITDTSGILRGKRIHVSMLDKVLQEGIRLPGSMFSMNVQGEIVYDTQFILEEGEADRLCIPIPHTLAPTPWSNQAIAQVLTTMVEPNGQGFFADPRQVLATVLKTLEAKGLHPMVAVELEFYLLDRERDADGALQPGRSLLTGRRQQQNQVYSMSELDDVSPILQDMVQACDGQGIKTHTIVAESASGHFEINLDHLPNVLDAADKAVMFKRVVKGVAAQHGMDATFMSKPFALRSGSGMHVHISLMDEDGKNVFASDETPLGSEIFHWAIGGLCQVMPESMAVFAPNANSFRRYKDRAFVPLAPCWGLNNRTTALRVPMGGADATRVEHRVPGADANIYLVIAAMLAGIDYGITHQSEPPLPADGNAYDQYPPSLPRTWQDALRAFDQGRILPTYFGKDYCFVYGQCKWAEYRTFNDYVTPLELDWYLYSV